MPSFNLCLKGLQPEHSFIIFFRVKVQLLRIHVAGLLIRPANHQISKSNCLARSTLYLLLSLEPPFLALSSCLL